MYKLEDIAERIRQNFDVRTSKRDEALKQGLQEEALEYFKQAKEAWPAE